MSTVVLITNLKFEDSNFNSSRLLIYSMEEEQSVLGASNSSTASIDRTIETEIGSNIRENSDNNIDILGENSDNNIDILGEEAQSNDCKLPKPSILDQDNKSDLEDIEFLQSMKNYGSMLLCNLLT